MGPSLSQRVLHRSAVDDTNMCRVYYRSHNTHPLPQASTLTTGTNTEECLSSDPVSKIQQPPIYSCLYNRFVIFNSLMRLTITTETDVAFYRRFFQCKIHRKVHDKRDFAEGPTKERAQAPRPHYPPLQQVVLLLLKNNLSENEVLICKARILKRRMLSFLSVLD